MSSSSLIHRTANTLLGTVGAMLVSIHAAAAQAPQGSSWEVRVPTGSFVPTGDQRDVLKSGSTTALQVSRVLNPAFAITGTVSWARSRVINSADAPKLDAFTSDLGVEYRPARWFAGGPVTLDAFAGAGAGMRSYNYRKLDIAATHNLAGYGAVGGELGMGRFGLRVEVRDYVAGFRSLTGAGAAGTRNDVVVTAALRFNRSRNPQN